MRDKTRSHRSNRDQIRTGAIFGVLGATVLIYMHGARPGDRCGTWTGCGRCGDGGDAHSQPSAWTGGAVVICEPCQVGGHTGNDCDDAHRTQLIYRSCPCQHWPVEHATTPNEALVECTPPAEDAVDIESTPSTVV